MGAGSLPTSLPKILDSISLPRSAPEAAFLLEKLLTRPKKYQLQGLAWMMEREGVREKGGGRTGMDLDMGALVGRETGSESEGREQLANEMEMGQESAGRPACDESKTGVSHRFVPSSSGAAKEFGARVLTLAVGAQMDCQEKECQP